MPGPEVTEVLKRARKYAAEVQKLNRPQQLVWFGQKLSIQPEVLLRLIGYRSDVAKRHAERGESVEKLAERKPDETLWVTELFREMVFRHGYDVPKVAKTFHGPVPEAVEVPISTTASKSSRPKRGVPGLLLRKIRTGGPSVYRDLTDYVRLTNPGKQGFPIKTQG
ncbi:MAG: hypothetical protein MUF18_11295 [Fimbriiglobus sp.]|nr:hypothetical protein [Fimbriiglobus sp.]